MSDRLRRTPVQKCGKTMEIKPMTNETGDTKELITTLTLALSQKAALASDANDALKYSQSALNLAHTLATLHYMK